MLGFSSRHNEHRVDRTGIFLALSLFALLISLLTLGACSSVGSNFDVLCSNTELDNSVGVILEPPVYI